MIHLLNNLGMTSYFSIYPQFTFQVDILRWRSDALLWTIGTFYMT